MVNYAMHHLQNNLPLTNLPRDLILLRGRLAWPLPRAVSVWAGGGGDDAALVSDGEACGRGGDGRRGEVNGFEGVVVGPLGGCGGEDEGDGVMVWGSSLL